MASTACGLGDRGATLLEVIAVVGVLGVSTGVAVSRLNAGSAQLDSARQELIASLRLCRSQAVASGNHCRVELASDSAYRVQRMLPPSTPGDPWLADASFTRVVPLPSTVRLSPSSGSFEFDTRGSRIDATQRTLLTLVDSGYGRQLTVEIWPSGQVNPS